MSTQWLTKQEELRQAGEIFQMNLTVAATAAGTATVEVYGTLDDA